MSSSALDGISTSLLEELARRTAQIPADVTPERTMERMRSLAEAFAAEPTREFLIRLAAEAIAGVAGIERRGWR